MTLAMKPSVFKCLPYDESLLVKVVTFDRSPHRLEMSINFACDTPQ